VLRAAGEGTNLKQRVLVFLDMGFITVTHFTPILTSCVCIISPALRICSALGKCHSFCICTVHLNVEAGYYKPVVSST